MKYLLLLLLLLPFFFFPSDSLQNRNNEEQHPPYWLKFKALFNHAQSYLFPPNLDFRRSIGNEEEGGGKVTEAVAKSLGEESATVENSAKFAAEKMHQTAQKLKDTFSSHRQPPQEL